CAREQDHIQCFTGVVPVLNVRDSHHLAVFVTSFRSEMISPATFTDLPPALPPDFNSAISTVLEYLSDSLNLSAGRAVMYRPSSSFSHLSISRWGISLTSGRVSVSPIPSLPPNMLI